MMILDVMIFIVLIILKCYLFLYLNFDIYFKDYFGEEGQF